MTAAVRAVFSIGLLVIACGPPAFRISVTFPGPLELEPGAEVRYHGLRVGYVTGVALRQPEPAEPPLVEVSLAIEDPGVTLREADVFEVVGGGLLGDSYLRVTPAPETSPPLAPGATVAGLPPLVTRWRDSTAEALDALGELAKEQRDALLDALAGMAEEPPATE